MSHTSAKSCSIHHLTLHPDSKKMLSFATCFILCILFVLCNSIIINTAFICIYQFYSIYLEIEKILSIQDLKSLDFQK